MARILLIDDEPPIRIITRKMLEKAGHEVVEATSGEEGLKILETERPDIILLDVMMPGINGWEVCERIKADDNLKDIPVVMFTVVAEKDSEGRGATCGADGYINKPFEIEDLLETVEDALAGVAN